jgi:hypothetical protein
MSLLPILAYAVAGFGREVLCVLYYRAVSTRRPFRASGLAGGIELYDLIVLASIIKSGWDPLLLIAYTVGVVGGTYCATRISK